MKYNCNLLINLKKLVNFEFYFKFLIQAIHHLEVKHLLNNNL